MTTIAFRDGVLAADTLAVDDEIDLKSHCTKIFLLADCIVAISGDYHAGLRFVEWLKAGRPKRKPNWGKKASFEAYVLTKTGLTAWDENLSPVPNEDEFCAIGGGGPVATGAMEMGATAIRAVEVATKWHSGTGGRVEHFRLEDLS